jgi:hypothetical protein
MQGRTLARWPSRSLCPFHHRFAMVPLPGFTGADYVGPVPRFAHFGWTDGTDLATAFLPCEAGEGDRRAGAKRRHDDGGGAVSARWVLLGPGEANDAAWLIQ